MHHDYSVTVPAMSEPPTLYQWVKGRPAIARLIDCFYDRVERDDLLSPFFPGGVSAEHREHVTTWWCEVFGGPAGYTERLGGYPAMLAHHRDLAITAEQRFQFASLMSLAADDAALPDDPEFRAALVGYLEWGTRLAMHNSQPGARHRRRGAGPALGLGRGPALPAVAISWLAAMSLWCVRRQNVNGLWHLLLTGYGQVRRVISWPAGAQVRQCAWRRRRE